MSDPRTDSWLDPQVLAESWASEKLWRGIRRPYAAEEVVRLRGSFPIAHTLAERGARRLWKELSGAGFLQALGAVTGNQAMQQVKAGLPARYFMAINNKKGVMCNDHDDLEGLRNNLAQFFSESSVNVVGCMALFWARK